MKFLVLKRKISMFMMNLQSSKNKMQLKPWKIKPGFLKQK